jgi:hypothetical protein
LRLGVVGDGGARSCRGSPPFDVDEPCELAERLSAVAAEPAVIVAEDVEAVAVDRALDPRP